MNFNDITITSLETITAFDIATGGYLFTLDELQKASIAQSQESTEITGKAGRKLSSLKRNKGIKISGSNGLVSGGLLEMQTGGKFENKTTEVMWTDYLTVSAGHTAETKYIATGTTGAEIDALYKRETNGVLGDVYSQGTEVKDKVFTYNPETKTITLPDTVEAGTEIVVYYKRKIQANVLENVSDNYSGKCTMFIDVMGEDKCANVYRIQFYLPKVDFSGEFTLDLGDGQTVHSFDAEALAGACGAGGSYFTYTVFGADAADVTEGNGQGAG